MALFAINSSYKTTLNSEKPIFNNRLTFSEFDNNMLEISKVMQKEENLFAKPMPIQKNRATLSENENINNIGNKILPSKSNNNKPPETPWKKKGPRRFEIEESDRVFKLPKTSPFQEIRDKISNNTFEINNNKVNTKYFAEGSYLEAFYVDTQDKQSIVEDVPNEQVILKVFLELHANKNDKCETRIKNSKGNYQRTLKLNLHCAKWYNVETAVSDKYYLVEKIPFKLNIKDEDQIKQVRKFFKVTRNNCHLCDLAYGNFQVTKEKDGTVKLIDFVEKGLDYHDLAKYRVFAIQFLKSWVTECNSRESANQLLQKLTKGLGFDQDWINAALNEYFMEVKTSTQ